MGIMNGLFAGLALGSALAAAFRPCFAAEVFPLLPSSRSVAMRPEKAVGYVGGFVRDGDEFVCDNGTSNGVRGVLWHLLLNQTRPDPLVVAAEGLAETEGDAGEFSLYLDVTYVDGDHLWGQKEAFSADPAAGWQSRSVTVFPSKPIKAAYVYLLNRDRSGRVRFRAPVWRTYDVGAVKTMDLCPVLMDSTPRVPCFLVRDVAENGGYLSIAPGEDECGLSVQVKCEKGDAGEVFDVVVAEKTGRDRAVTLLYAVPLPEGAVEWHENPRRSEEFASGERMSVTAQPCGRGLLSRWPFGAVTVGGRGIALGMDPSAPAFYRVVANATSRQLFIAFDLGFAKERPSAHFRFCKFAFAGAERFRGALEAYWRLYPESVRVRCRRQGVWMPFHKISAVRGWEDFGFLFKEGDNEPAWDDAHGMLTFRYTEPCTWWMGMTGKDGYSLADCAAEARRLAGQPNSGKMARGWAASRFLDERGRPVGKCLDTPWCKGAVWSVNSAPGIAGEMTDWKAKNGEPEFSARFAKPFPQGLDGEYVDSAEMYVTAALDFDRAHFAGMDTPLCFSRSSFRPGVFKGLIGYEYVRALARRVHANGRLMMANSTPSQWCWLAPHLDVMGTETDWNGRSGGVRSWRPMCDEDMMYRRALCGGKPYCFLMNTDFDKFSYAMSEKFMQRSLAYGMFPGYFSANAATGHYFSRPELYDRDRPLFRKYVPLCKAVAEAGWQAVNRLWTSDNPSVVTEQFGVPGAGAGDCFATVFNLSDRPQGATLRLRDLSVRPVAECVAGAAVSVKDGTLSLSLPPETVRVFRFAPCSR